MEGNIAWVLISTALVLFMTPGLAFFYGGMVRSKNFLAMLMQNFFAIGLLAVLWHTGKPTGPDCRAEQAAHAEARPGFVALAGNGVEACFKP